MRTLSTLFLAVTIAVLSLTTLATTPAHAQNCGVAPPAGVGNCLTEFSTMAGVDVFHYSSIGTNIVPVEPDDTDSWIITATHSSEDNVIPQSCECNNYTSSVTADVTWTGSGWSVACTGCNWPNGPILSLGVCAVSGCSAIGGTHGWEYKLTARVKEFRPAVCGANNGYLYSVEFETTSVDDGDVIVQFDCSEGSSVSPTSQTWSDVDLAFGCNLNCGSVTGPTIYIQYN